MTNTTHTKTKKDEHTISAMRMSRLYNGQSENGGYIGAPAQCGKNSINRSTYGHSLIIEPMGKIIASAKSKTGIIYARVDESLSTQAKKMIPSWNIDERY